jgi:hypothetical protein
MFNSPVLDLVILLSFTYFIGSLILSAINEAIAGTFRLRQKELRKGLYHFFLDPQWKLFVKNTLLKSPHIQSLMKKEDRVPAYIPARNFVLALIENLDTGNYVNGNIVSAQKTKGTVTKDIIPRDAIIVMETIMKQANLMPLKAEEFEKRLEEFYNNTMDRVTGWYKKRIRRILFVLAFILAVSLNIDTIKVINDAMTDKAKLGRAVENIAANLPKFDSLRKAVEVKDSAGSIEIRQIVGNASDTIKNLKVTYDQTTGYSLGYRDTNDFKTQWRESFWKKLLGILLTVFALQMGSNYWFELMNKAVNVRAVGKKPDEKKS